MVRRYVNCGEHGGSSVVKERVDDLIEEVEALRERLLAAASPESAVTRDSIGRDLDILVRDLEATRERADGTARRPVPGEAE